MKDTKIIDEFKTILTDERKQLVLGAVSKAFRENLEVHDPDLGHDNMSFGLLVYKSKVKFIADVLKPDLEVEGMKTSPYLEFRIGRFVFSTFSASDDTSVDEQPYPFPNNECRASLLARENYSQLMLEGIKTRNVRDKSPDIHVMILTVGSSISGLKKLLFAIPDKAEKKVSSYLDVQAVLIDEKLHSQNQDMKTIYLETLVPEEVIPDVVIERKKDDKKEEL